VTLKSLEMSKQPCPAGTKDIPNSPYLSAIHG